MELGKTPLALKMKTKTIDGTDYLFIEAGGFTSGKPKDWHPGWYVLKQVKSQL